MKKKSKNEAIVYFITMGLIVAVDLLTGVLCGFIASVALIAKRSKDMDVQELEKSTDKVTFKFSGKASFLQIPKISTILHDLEQKHITIDLKDMTYVDWAVEEQLASWRDIQSKRGIKAEIVK